MNKSNLKVRQFIDDCKAKYGKSISPKENAMEVVTKKIDITKVKGFTWKNMGQAWGMAEADLLTTTTKETGSLRVLWYRSFKLYAMRVMGKNADLLKANSLLSTGLAELVRTGEYMYSSFAVEDFAYNKSFTEFINKLNVVLFVEKMSEFPKFQRTCDILGIKVIMAGSGRPNFSSTEYIFTNYFTDEVDAEHPIRILTLSDLDYDGVVPIAQGFVKQMRHYSPHVLVGRVGLESEQIPKSRQTVDDALYEVKQDNKNAPKDKWMQENLFVDKNGRYLGAEVESNSFAFYYSLIWDALKSTGVTYQDYLDQRYADIQPDAKTVTKDIATELLKNELSGIEEQIESLKNERLSMINEKMEELKPLAIQVRDDPEFIKYQSASGEESMYAALKSQRKWTGGLRYNTQTTEFKRRVKELVEGKV